MAAAVSGAFGGWHVGARRRLRPNDEGGQAVYVRLSSQDAAALARIETALARLLDAEAQTQAALARMADVVQTARTEQAQRQGEIVGMLHRT